MSLWQAIEDIAPTHPTANITGWSMKTDDLALLVESRGLTGHGGFLADRLTQCGPDDLQWSVKEVGDRLFFTLRD